MAKTDASGKAVADKPADNMPYNPFRAPGARPPGVGPISPTAGGTPPIYSPGVGGVGQQGAAPIYSVASAPWFSKLFG